MTDEERGDVRAYPTMVSDLIRELKTILDDEGDMPVFTKAFSWCTAKIDVGTIPYYYDGGCLLPAVDTEYHCEHWLRSKTHGDLYPRLCEIGGDEPEKGWDDDPTDKRDTIDGEPVPGLRRLGPTKGGSCTKTTPSIGRWKIWRR